MGVVNGPSSASPYSVHVGLLAGKGTLPQNATFVNPSGVINWAGYERICPHGRHGWRAQNDYQKELNVEELSVVLQEVLGQ